MKSFQYFYQKRKSSSWNLKALCEWFLFWVSGEAPPQKLPSDAWAAMMRSGSLRGQFTVSNGSQKTPTVRKLGSCVWLAFLKSVSRSSVSEIQEGSITADPVLTTRPGLFLFHEASRPTVSHLHTFTAAAVCEEDKQEEWEQEHKVPPVPEKTVLLFYCNQLSSVSRK